MQTIARKRGLLAALAGLALAVGAGVSYAHNPPPDVSTAPPPVIDIPVPQVLPPPPVVDPPCVGADCGSVPPRGTQETPEPATLLSGLVGGSLAGLYGLRRRKKQKQENATE